jgi:hypothetical protein
MTKKVQIAKLAIAIKRTIFTLVVCLIGAAGCVSYPRQMPSHEINQEKLSNHVRFFSQDRLAGRKPWTWESAVVREYLKARFESYGLKPWGCQRSFDQSFGMGTNVIGVLPGSDPNLADQIVLVSAHYDHLGKDKKGIYHGACDNASGVAALLEIAEYFSLSDHRPARSICFACFDCEEKFLLGSVAFTCRDDFDPSKIAAIINMDMLGRDFLDVCRDTLFVVGTETYPQLRDGIMDSGGKNALEILPISSELIGPRGDHAAFEHLDIPVLFFSCGVNKDYHKPTDTADKLNYAAMKKSAGMIADTIRMLSDKTIIEKPTPQDNPDFHEAETIARVFSKIASNYQAAGLKADQAKILEGTAADAKQKFDEHNYSRQDRLRYLSEILEILPIFDGSRQSSVGGDNPGFMLCLAELYSRHKAILMNGYRTLMKDLLGKPPGPFGKIHLRYEKCDLLEENIHFEKITDQQYEFYVFLPQFYIYFEKKSILPWSSGGGFGFMCDLNSCRGTKEEIEDFCLLKWEEKPRDQNWGQAWQKILEKITGDADTKPYDVWLNRRLSEGGYADHESWLLSLAKSGNTDLARFVLVRAQTSSSKSFHTAICEIIQDQQADALTKAKIIENMGRKTTREELLAVTTLLNDTSPCDIKLGVESSLRVISKYPCCHDVFKKIIDKELKIQSWGDLAKNKLKELTKQNFGKDAQAWKKWIQANYKQQ